MGFTYLLCKATVPDLEAEDLGLNSVSPLHLVQTWEDPPLTENIYLGVLI